MATFKTEQQIYDDVKAYITENTDLTNWSEGSPERAIARLVAFALSMAWKILYLVYSNIWPTTGDAAGLRNWYEVFGLTWSGESTEAARKQVLAKFRERSMGTADWYEKTAVDQFPAVTDCHFVAGVRGPNTADLIVLHHAADCMQTTVEDVQAYFDNAQRKLCTFDVQVKTYSDIEGTISAVAEMVVAE
ncbi:MAG: hypothetical protein V3W11_06355 [bacterium]